jgi:seryl-tRNA synthetase
MHDIRAIRENRETYVQGWTARGVSDAETMVAELVDTDERLRAAQTAAQAAQARRNELSKGIGQAKARKDEVEAGRLLAEVEALKASGAAEAEAERGLVEQLRERLAGLPNLAAADVPPGEDESGNLTVKGLGPHPHTPAHAAAGGGPARKKWSDADSGFVRITRPGEALG